MLLKINAPDSQFQVGQRIYFNGRSWWWQITTRSIYLQHTFLDYGTDGDEFFSINTPIWSYELKNSLDNRIANYSEPNLKDELLKYDGVVV